jgi:CRP-like cAMP-binding protein
MSLLAHAPPGRSAPHAANSILARLAASDLDLLEPIDYLRLRRGFVLLEAGVELKHVYFPTSGVVSFVEADARGGMLEIAHVGAEGMIGISALLNAEPAHERALVQIAGHAYRVSVSSARSAFARSPTLRELALQFAGLLIMQLSQNVFCKLAHSVEQQFAGRLLLYAERSRGPALEMTHEQMAEALGTRRQGITEVARRLQSQQVIAYSRGRISVLDWAALEQHACPCHRVVRDVYNRPGIDRSRLSATLP